MCEVRDVFIVGAARTAIGNFLGSLKGFRASDLGGMAIAEAVRRAGLAGDDIDEVIMGNVVSAGLGQAPARQASISIPLGMTWMRSAGAPSRLRSLASASVRACSAVAWLSSGRSNRRNVRTGRCG